MTQLGLIKKVSKALDMEKFNPKKTPSNVQLLVKDEDGENTKKIGIMHQ